jgi:hypothetical protein
VPGLEHGFQRGFSTIVGALFVGLVIGVGVPDLVQAGVIPAGMFSGFIVLSIISIIMMVDASRYWSFSYLAGFVMGVFFALPALSQTDFIGLTDWILYGGAAIGAVALRLKIHA